MSRVKGGVHALKRRRKMLKLAKGFRFGRSTKERQAREALQKAHNYAFRDRRAKKRTFRRLWTVRINAAVREHGMSYSKFIAGLGKNNIGLNRKVLSEIAQKNPEAFAHIVKAAQK